MGRGGRRTGAGRPRGSKDRLGPGSRGQHKALVALVVAKRRLGKVDDPEALAVLERCYERVADVLDERVSSFQAPMVLRAAAAIADGVAGPQASRVQVDGRMTLEHLVMASYQQPRALPPGEDAQRALSPDEPRGRLLPS